MPTLTDNTRRRLNAYRLTRNGQHVPGTEHGNLHSAACWSWALTGRLVGTDDPNSPSSIYRSIFEDSLVPDPRNPDAVLAIDYGAVFRDVVDQFPGCEAEFGVIRQHFQTCRDADVGARAADERLEQVKIRYEGNESERAVAARRSAAQQAAQARTQAWTVSLPEKIQVMQAMMGICARRNGLVPAGPGDAAIYTLHMRTSRWYGWDHWGIGVRTLPSGTLNYIQTVPNFPLSHSADVMWDEHMKLASIGIAGLLQTHVDVINRIPSAAVRLAKCHQNNCAATHGWWLSIKNHWHRCTTCGTVWCPAHGSSLPGKHWSSPLRTCSVCHGRTELMT